MSKAYQLLEQIADIEDKQDLLNDEIASTESLIAQGNNEMQANQDRMDRLMASALSKSLFLDQQDRKKLDQKMDSILSIANKSRIEQKRLIDLLSDVSKIKAVADIEKEKYDKYLAEMKKAGESQINAQNEEIRKKENEIKRLKEEIDNLENDKSKNRWNTRLKNAFKFLIACICVVVGLAVILYGTSWLWNKYQWQFVVVVSLPLVFLVLFLVHDFKSF